MATHKQVAEHLDLSTVSIAELIKNGIIPPAKGGPGGLDLDAARVAYIRNLRGKAAGRIRQTPESTDGSRAKLESERARLTMHQANQAELDEGLLRGELVRVTDVEHQVTDAFRRVRARLLSLSTKVTPLVVGSTDTTDIKSRIDACVEEALNELTIQDE